MMTRPRALFVPGTAGSSFLPGVVLIDTTTTGDLATVGAGTNAITFTPLPPGGYSWIAR